VPVERALDHLEAELGHGRRVGARVLGDEIDSA
jgi:hypothetical protein